MKRIVWLVNRLRAMSVWEMLFRIYRVLLQQGERVLVIAGWTPRPANAISAKGTLFGIGGQVSEEWSSCFELDRTYLRECLSGRVSFFGCGYLDVGRPVDWHRDPLTGVTAPRVFGKALNYRNENIVGNVKFTWELGRHQHLIPLAVAYTVTGDPRYQQEVVDQIDGWIEQNPYGIGIHWSSSLEVSLRLIAWAVIHSLLALRDGEAGLFAAVGDGRRLGRSIYEQTFFIRHFLSRYSSANNHLIGELAGLWVTCSIFDLGRRGVEWADFAHRELEIEASKQVHIDGVNKEQAFYYHLWVLEYLVFVWVSGTRTGSEFSNQFCERIQAMTRFLQDVGPDCGEPPQIGDSDNGFVVRFEPSWPGKPYREMLDAVDYIFDRTGKARNQKAFWYQAVVNDRRGNKAVLAEQTWRRTYPVVYPHGGYCVLGGAGCHIVFDGGPLGYLSIAAHGHADALSFCLAIDGDWWLVDPGTYAYHSDGQWRSYFRGTSAHNTVRVNGQDQSRIAGAFMWQKKADAEILSTVREYDKQSVTASHNGYNSLGVVHTRTLRYYPATVQLEVIDELAALGKTTQPVEIYYHFAPGIGLSWEPAEDCWVATQPGSPKRLLLRMSAPWKYNVLRGSERPILGWYSPALQEKIPTNTLRGEAPLTTSLENVTQISIQETKNEPDYHAGKRNRNSCDVKVK